MVRENIGMEPGEHEVSPGMLADQILKQEGSKESREQYILDQETGEMVATSEFRSRRENRLDTGREQH